MPRVALEAWPLTRHGSHPVIIPVHHRARSLAYPLAFEKPFCVDGIELSSRQDSLLGSLL